MTGLAALELALANEQRFDLLDDTHLHRATLEDDLGVVAGREAIRERRVAEAAADGGRVAIAADLGDMIVVDHDGGWRCHRWARREGERIVHETVIADGALHAALHLHDPEAVAAARGACRPVHAPLGELRPGRGQLSESAAPRLPVRWPEDARAAATLMHRVWNGRALALLDTPDWTGPGGRSGDAAAQRRWLLELLAALPDAVLLFERAIVAGERIAILWRLHGHHLGEGLGRAPTGRRVRALGSSLLTWAGGRVAAEETMLDEMALRAQLHRPIIDHAG